MTTRWPDRLPLPTLEGYGVQPGEAVLRTEMEAGPARQRRRFTDVPSRIAVRWVLRPDQFALFEAWYRWVGGRGRRLVRDGPAGRSRPVAAGSAASPASSMQGPGAAGSGR